VLEIGAGDGSMMLRLARARARRWPGVELTLLDQQPLVAAPTLAAFRELGWSPRVEVREVLGWLDGPVVAWDVVFANLFVHHFDPPALSRLLAGIAARARVFFCCEPRRAPLALLGSRLVGLIGANEVSRADAVSSVDAGFRDRELSEAWPQKPGWDLREYPAGLFSHCFLARRMEG
jgi:hypothetical protein